MPLPRLPEPPAGGFCAFFPSPGRFFPIFSFISINSRNFIVDSTCNFPRFWHNIMLISVFLSSESPERRVCFDQRLIFQRSFL